MTPEQDALVLGHQNLIHYVLRRLVPQMGYYGDQDGLFGAGQFGLVQAARSFSPDRQTKFANFAITRIHGAVLDEARNHYNGGRQALHRHSELNAAMVGLADKAAWPTIAQHLGWTQAKLHRIRAEVCFNNPGSLEYHFDLGREVPGVLVGPEESLDRKEDIAAVHAALLVLNPRQQRIMREYFFQERFMADIAADLDITESRVSQVVGECLKKMRAFLITKEFVEETAIKPRKRKR